MKLIATCYIMLTLLFSSCTGDFFSSIKWYLYESIQDYQQNECRKDPTIICPEKESYEQYQKKREELSKKDN